MDKRRAPSRMHWRLVACAFVLLAAGAAAVIVAAGGDSDPTAADRDARQQAAIEQVVYDYRAACASTYVVPAELRNRILAQREALVGDGTLVRLGLAVKDAIDGSYEDALKALCTPGFAKRQLRLRADHGLCAAATLEETLNRTDISPLLSEELVIVDAEPAGCGEDVARLRLTLWIGDTLADGARLEAWGVYEYTMVQDGVTWRIDNERETWAYFDADYDQWGPSSPHDEGESTADD